MNDDYETIERVIRYVLANYHSQPSMSTLARVAGLSEGHFHRLFGRWAGTTPKAFLKFITATRAKTLLAESRDVLGTSLEVGLSSPGRLHDLLVSVEAMTPGEFKARGRGLEVAYGFHPTPFGLCLIGLTRRGICHLAFHGDEDGERSLLVGELRGRWPNADFRADQRLTGEAVKRVFGPRTAASRGARRIRVLAAGTPFQLKVWEALLRVPPGRLVSYSELATAIGAPGCARAVGRAVGGNSIAYLIPCHRVIRETGELAGYRWGVERKLALLAREFESGDQAP